MRFFFPSGAAIFAIAFLMKQIIKDRVCYHYKYHYRYRYRCPCDWKSFLKFGTNFRHTAGWFSYVFLRDGPGRGHCLYKQCNTPKQTRLRKALLHYFWQSLRHKGQQGSAIVSALKTGCASRPIFSKVMLSSDQKWIIALTHHCFVCWFYESIDKARSIHSTSTKQPTKDCTRGQAQILTRAKAITKHHLKHPTLWRKFRAKS